MEKDFYSILAVPPSAGADEIKKSYRKLAQEFHPDHFHNRSEEERKSANERMVEITEAFRVLSNATERAEYDKKRGETRVAKAAESAATVATATAPQAPPGRPSGARSSLGRDVARDFLLKIFAQLMAKGDAIQWKEQRSPPREWTKIFKSDGFGESFSLLFYQTRDATPSMVRQFLRNAEAFVKGQKSFFRNDFMIFVLAFEKLPSPDEVMAMCNKFERMGKSGPLTSWRAVVVLLDAASMRSVFCGRPMPVDTLKRTFQVLQGKW